MDYVELYDRSKKLAEVVGKARQLKVTNAKGTEITARNLGVGAAFEAGRAHNPGTWAMFPTGAVLLGPEDGSGEGTIVFDSYMTFGKLKEKVKFTVKKSRRKR